MTKSYPATLASTLLVESELDEHKLIPFYLPEIANTAYADATLRQVLPRSRTISSEWRQLNGYAAYPALGRQDRPTKRTGPLLIAS